MRGGPWNRRLVAVAVVVTVLVTACSDGVDVDEGTYTPLPTSVAIVEKWSERSNGPAFESKYYLLRSRGEVGRARSSLEDHFEARDYSFGQNGLGVGKYLVRIDLAAERKSRDPSVETHLTGVDVTGNHLILVVSAG